MKFVYTIFVLFAAIYLAHANLEDKDQLVLIVSSDRGNTLNGRIMVTLTTQKGSQVIQFDKTNSSKDDGKTYLFAKGDIPKNVEKASFFYESANFENLFIHSLTVIYDGNQGKAFFLMEKNISSNSFNNEVNRKYN